MSIKTKSAYAGDKIMHTFVEAMPEIVDGTIAELEKQYNEYKAGLDEIWCMIQYSQDLGDAEEVSFWRRLLMHNKMVMREIKQKSFKKHCFAMQRIL